MFTRYVIPGFCTSYLHVQTTRTLKVKETPVTLVLYDARSRSTRSARSSAASVHGYRYLHRKCLWTVRVK